MGAEHRERRDAEVEAEICRTETADERAYVEAHLASYGGHVTRMASWAGMARTYLHRLLRRHGLEA